MAPESRHLYRTLNYHLSSDLSEKDEEEEVEEGSRRRRRILQVGKSALDHVISCLSPLQHAQILALMSDSDSGGAGSVAHAPKARKGQDGQVAKLRDRFEHPMSQSLTVVPASARRSARVASAGQLHKTGKRSRPAAQPSGSEAPAASSAADPSVEPLQGFTCKSLCRAFYRSTCRYSGRHSGQDQGTGAEPSGFSAAQI